MAIQNHDCWYSFAANAYWGRSMSISISSSVETAGNFCFVIFDPNHAELHNSVVYNGLMMLWVSWDNAGIGCQQWVRYLPVVKAGRPVNLLYTWMIIYRKIMERSAGFSSSSCQFTPCLKKGGYIYIISTHWNWFCHPSVCSIMLYPIIYWYNVMS